MGDLLIATSVMTCPHAGVVTPVPTDAALAIAGATVVRSSDPFMIAGCSLSSVGSPCVSVEWMVPSAVSSADGSAVLTTDSVGLCLAATGAPQGTVLIAAAGQTVAPGD